MWFLAYLKFCMFCIIRSGTPYQCQHVSLQETILYLEVMSCISVLLSERQCHLHRNWLKMLIKNGDNRKNKQAPETQCYKKKKSEYKKIFSDEIWQIKLFLSLRITRKDTWQHKEYVFITTHRIPLVFLLCSCDLSNISSAIASD